MGKYNTFFVFFKNGDDKKARCKKCLAVLSYNGTTSGLLRHLKSKHGEDLTTKVTKAPSQEPGSPIPKRTKLQTTILGLIPKPTVEEIIAKEAALYGASFQYINN